MINVPVGFMLIAMKCQSMSSKLGQEVMTNGIVSVVVVRAKMLKWGDMIGEDDIRSIVRIIGGEKTASKKDQFMLPQRAYASSKNRIIE